MTIRILICTALLSCFAVNTATAHGPAVPAETVFGILNFSKPDAHAADEFFTQLETNTGKVIQLNLEIIPRQGGDDVGYELLSKQLETGENSIICGNGRYGLVDNEGSGFTLTFNHPQNFHSPTKINIGDRHSFPFQSVHCGIENYTSQTYTNLEVSGTFLVFSAEIPTAMEIVLFPLEALHSH
ncbi:MAG: hypothetical protein ABJO09_05195 [Hyphomicrobiales bacterium]